MLLPSVADPSGKAAIGETLAGMMKAATEKGRYVVVWQKQADGSGKALIDAPVSDAPEDPRKP